MSSLNVDSIQRLYVAYFNRPADPVGETYWIGKLDAITGGAVATQAQLTTFATSNFSPSAEFTATYAGLTNAQIVDALYLNLFGRHAESAGLLSWAGKLTDGSLTFAQLALTLTYSAQGTDAIAIANKVAAADLFTAAIDTTPEITGYSGAAANQIARNWLSSVTSDAATLTAATANVNATVSSSIAAGASAGNTFTLTTGVDTFAASTPTSNNTFNAATGTFSSLDTLTGSANGYNALNVISTESVAVPAGVSVTNIQTVNVRSASTVTLDTTPWTGTTALNVTQATGATLTADGTTAVTVSGVTGPVVIDGASTETVTAGTGSGAITLGGATAAVGVISVTDTAQGANNISIDGGTTVDVTTSGVSTGTITIGGTTKPSGAITISETGKAYAAGPAVTLGAITSTGGTTVSVTEVATSSTAAAATDAAATAAIITQSAITVNGGSATTAVTVNQGAAVTAVNAVIAVSGVTESASTVFTALAAGQTLIVGGLTFTAGAAGTTAAQTAAAFANLSNGAIQGNSALGTYSGAFAGWSTGAASGTGSTTVVFTSSTANSNVTDLAFTGIGLAAATVTTTQGAAATKAVTGVAGVAQGVVHIADVNYNTGTNTIATATVNGYGAGSSVNSDALTSLSLANSASTFAVGDHTATTLGLTLNKVTGAVTLDAGGATYSTLNVTTATADSAFALTGAAVKVLTVAGTNALDLTGSALGALKTVTVAGSAGLTLNASGATVTDFNASATSGAVTATIDATKATYEGGSGVDTVTLSAAAPSKAISLGAGNDILILANGTSSVTGAISGGDGTDTLQMVAADAVIASGSALFAGKVTGFEVLSLTGGTGAQTVHVDVLGGYNSVTTGGEANGGVLTLDGFTSGGTLALTSNAAGNGAYVVSSSAWTTPATDVFNVITRAAGALTAGTVTAANVETINITATDSTANVVANTNTHTLTLVATSATSEVITGNAHLTLTNTGNTALTSIDASGMTAGLTVTTAGTHAETVHGGASANALTAAAGTTVADILIGGAGADVLTANAGLDTLTGAGGRDTFVVATSGANVNIYTTITDATAGDSIQLFHKGTDVFTAAKVVLGDTAVFQDYANTVVNNGGDSSVNAHIGWFQWNNNTYIVESEHNATGAGLNFTNGGDLVVKLAGLVDLSTASLNNGTVTTLLLA